MTAASSSQLSNPRSARIAAYVAGAFQRQYPDEVIAAAKQAIIDFVGVCVGAADDDPVRPVRQVVERWASPGKARMFLGGCTTPALAALVNGTMGHAMDFDDAHTMGAGHLSVPCGVTAFGFANELGSSEQDILAAFITGFEVNARLGGGGVNGVGRNLHKRGFHPTGILSRFGAASVAGALMRLPEEQIEYAMGIAATTAGGLLGSFGTHSKPFHSGKAAMDGILAAEMAAAGFQGAKKLFDVSEAGFLSAYIQEGKVEVPELDFEDRWEILRNGYKPYASGRAAHAIIKAAQTLCEKVQGRNIARVRARIHPNAALTMGNPSPRTALESKFSVRFCIALALRGYRLAATDFCIDNVNNPKLRELLPLIELEIVPDQPAHEALMDITLQGGEQLHSETKIVPGHPDNPMSAADFKAKFLGLVEPKIGTDRAAALLDVLQNFERPGSFTGVMSLVDAGARSC